MSDLAAPWCSGERTLIVPSSLVAAVHNFAHFEKPLLMNGPHFEDGRYRFFAERGRIDPHEDGAGLTMGLVLVADGPRFLEAQGQRWPLYPGSVYVIDSDVTHGAPCEWTDGLLAFVCIDFVKGRDPLPTPMKFAFEGLKAASRMFNLDLCPVVSQLEPPNVRQR